MELSDLKNKTILITGSAKRIGREIAIALAEYSPKLILHYRNSEKEILELLETVKKYNNDSYKIQCDFFKEDQIQNFIKHIEKEKIDILINSASVFPLNDNWENFHMAFFNKIIKVNLFIPLLLIKKCFESSDSGIVINFIDASLNLNSPNHFVYQLSKYSLEKATKILAKKLAPKIRINGIAPGAILPPAQLAEDNTIQEMYDYDEFFKKKLNSIPLRIPGNPTYIIKTIKFIIENDFLTGAIIPVDGGEYL
ncbi:MAG: SDR family oxidoreductase [Leptonema sp. (in: bacteria)]